VITFNADGQTQHIAAHYRPLSSLMFFSRLPRERFTGTPNAERFLAGEALKGHEHNGNSHQRARGGAQQTRQRGEEDRSRFATTRRERRRTDHG
jgi:hypothetical protein